MANKLVDATQLDADLTSVADAIRESGGLSRNLTFPGDFVTAIENIPGGGATLIEKNITQNGTYVASLDNADGYSQVAVNVSGGSSEFHKPQVYFYDYDGTLLYTYTREEFLALSSLPANPDHSTEGLTAQGWNWTKQEITTYINTYLTAIINVGQVYTTIDGKTRIYITLPDKRKGIYLGLCVDGTLIVDWGDESTSDTIEGDSLTSLISTQHTYPDNLCDFIITLTPGQDSTFAFYYDDSCCKLITADHVLYETTDVYLNSIKKIQIGGGINSLSEFAFNDCHLLSSVTIPNNITAINSYAFYSCYSLKSIVIPNSVTSIGEYTFNECYSCSTISIPNSITSLERYTFYYCYSLRSVTIPSSVTFIGEYAFDECFSLSEIVIPSSVTSIDDEVFNGCYSLHSIILSNGITSIGSSAFSLCYSISSIEIPDSVTTLEGSLFSACYALSSITLPSNLTSISYDIFTNCKSLTSIVLPENITSIGSYAFNGCSSLSVLTMPSSVTSIGSSAFGWCLGMKEYHFLSTTPPTLSSNVFKNIPSDCIIYVPSAAVNSYKIATNWSSYASYIQGE